MNTTFLLLLAVLFLAFIFDPEVQRIVERARAGDYQPLAQWWTSHRKALECVAQRMLNDRETAADVVADCYLHVQRQLPNFRGDAAFSTYVFRIVTNCSISHIRDGRRAAAYIPLEELQQQEPPATGVESDPEAVAQREAIRRLVRQELGQLSENHRTVLVMHHLAGTPIEEIAATLGESIGTIKSRLFRGREQLRKRLDPQLFGEVFE